MMTHRALASRGEGEIRAKGTFTPAPLLPFSPAPNRHRHTFLLKFSRRYHETNDQ